MSTARLLLSAALIVLGLVSRDDVAGQQVLWREDFASGAWEAAPAAGVQLATAIEGTGSSAAIRLDFDFQGRGGWAAARRRVDLAMPENWELRFRIRGSAPQNHLEIKFIDPSGENVWWSVRRDFQVPQSPALVRVKKRQVSFAWGPAGGGELKQVHSLEVTITAGQGGRGTVWLSEIELRALPPERPYSGTPRVVATAAVPGSDASFALDGRRDTAWVTPEGPSELTVEFGEPRLLGGLTLHWERGRAPQQLAVDVREPETGWREARLIERGGARTDLLLPDTEATAVRVRVLDAPGGSALSELVVRPLTFGESPNAFFETIAAESPRGSYPRGFSGEQQFWTIAGVDGDTEESLVSEDGAVEIGGYAPTLEPFLWTQGRLWSWIGREATPSLLDGDLPIPVLTWEQGGVGVRTTVLASGKPGESTLFVRYELQGTGRDTVTGRFLLAVRPFQANPPSQFLNRGGGVAPVGSIRCAPNGVIVDARAVTAAPAPGRCGTATFDEGSIADWLARGEVPGNASASDPFPYATGALAWDLSLARGERQTIVIAVPFHGTSYMAEPLAGRTAAAARELFEQQLARERAQWREKLDRVVLELPREAADLGATIRSSVAWILINRDGPAIQPGSRAYERSWIRDGTLTSAAMLRLGHAEEARAFTEWFARFQYPDGRIPCCVDKRGADPVPEHDSHGEFIHLVAEVTRFTQDRAFAARMFPHVERAAAAIDDLRRQRRTSEYTSGPKSIFFGLLPESISHEGYSAKPMHSYWDSGWGWRGLADAAWLATWLGRTVSAATYTASFEEMGRDLRASLDAVRAAHHITYVPGAAELGDFDSTSTTVMVDPVGIGALLDAAPLVSTFERYDQEIRARTEGRREWDVYTPYEVRHIGTYVRLGWRDGAQRLLRTFLADRRPAGWNQFPEVVTREVRKPRFLGDLPHGWVASDFIRSALDLFAYSRHDDALVLAAGVPAEWIQGGRGVSIRGLQSAWGPIAYDLSAPRGVLTLRVSALERWPAGGVKAALPLPPGVRTVTVEGREVNVDDHGMVPLSRLPATLRARWGR